jgi:CRP-like cAMP-binding protein
MSANRILSRLAPKDYALLQSHLELVSLPRGTRLQIKNQRIDHVYFLESGIVSVMSGSHETVEIAMVGREGMIGVSAALGDGSRSPFEARICIAGDGRRLSVRSLRNAMNGGSSLTAGLLWYANAFLNDVAQTAIANAVGTVEERVARWLLMAADRMTVHPLPVTQETLAAALGVRRAGVTNALAEMEREGVIARSRGVITVLDRKGLQRRCANGTYAQRSN